MKKNEKQLVAGVRGKKSARKKSKCKKDLKPKNKKPRLPELYPELDKEVSGILDNSISKMTGAKLNPEYKRKLYKSVAVLNDFVAKADPLCPRTSLKDFTLKYALAFQDYLVQVSSVTERRIKPRSLFSKHSDLKVLFNHALNRGVIDQNPFMDIKMPNIQKAQSVEHGYISESEIERITWIDTEKLKEMDIQEKYKFLLPRVMFKLCYETAARSCEIVSLCVEDIQVSQLRQDGLIPVTVIGGKQRPTGHSDTVWILYERIKPHIDIWLPVVKEYCRYKGIKQGSIEILKRGKKGIPLFISPKSLKLLGQCEYRTIFRRFLKDSNMPKIYWHHTHILRNSRIANWLKCGWNFQYFNQNARYKRYEQII